MFGETYEEFRDNVLRFLDHCVEKDLHLNADKVKLNCDAVPFFGHLLTKNGVKPDPKKVEAICNWPVPKDITQLQSFLGAVNYLVKFISLICLTSSFIRLFEVSIRVCMVNKPSLL